MAKSKSVSSLDPTDPPTDDFTASISHETGPQPVPADALADAEVVDTPAQTGPVALPPEERAEERPAPLSVQKPRGRFFPAVAGGAIAAGFGAAAALYVQPELFPGASGSAAIDMISGRLDAQDRTIAALKTKDSPDSGLATQFAGIKTSVASAQADQAGKLTKIEEAIDGLAGRVDGLDTRTSALEQTPISGDASSAAAVESFRREMEALKSEVAAQTSAATAAQGDIQKAAEAAAQRIKDAEDQAAKLRAEADAAAKAAAAQAAISHLRAALDGGGPLDTALSELRAAGLAVPSAIGEQSGGVPGLAALKAAFPAAARDALNASIRATAPDSWTGRLTAFVRSETGARSLIPRPGDDPDAVLSRAEASVISGDLAAGIAALAALPQAGQDRMADWIALAQKRLLAESAVAALAAAVN